VSPLDQPVEIRVTATRADLIAFLERLESEESLRIEFANNPWEILRDAGIEVSPPEALPSKAAELDPAEIRRALDTLRGEPEWPYIFWWWWPYMGLLRPPEGGGSETA
jgi:hypothetical protein